MNPFSDKALLNRFGTEFGVDLFKLEIDTVVVRWCSVDLQHGLFGPFCLALAEVKARGFGQQEHQTAQDEWPYKPNS